MVATNSPRPSSGGTSTTSGSARLAPPSRGAPPPQRKPSRRPRLLTSSEVARAKDAYDRSGGIGREDLLRLKEVLEELGVAVPFPADLKALVQNKTPPGGVCDPHQSCLLLEEFLAIVDALKAAHEAHARDTDGDLVDAFVAMGGNIDKSGEVLVQTLRETFTDFQLPIDLDRLVAEVDTNNDGTVDFSEFSYLLSEQAEDLESLLSGLNLRVAALGASATVGAEASSAC
eukprot:RCo024455